ncbi:MAG: hypothetical protein PUF72_00260 [Clostridiales bacterium]|nr:hypothetical protein [Clostridiales bacterium]
MRSCIYCGKELEKDEKCSCPQAQAHRRAREAAQGQPNESGKEQTGYQYTNQQSNTYHTGYTKRENAIKHAWEKHRAKKRARAKNGNTGVWDDIWQSFVNTIKAPVNAVTNPRYISRASIVLLAMIQGAVIWLCMYFLRTGIVRSPFGLMMSIITINPGKASSLLWMLMTIVSGALGGVVFFVIYSGVFYLINRYIFKRRSGFWNFSQRMILTSVPFTLICIIGCVFGLISSTTLAIMIVCGATAMIALTYEALRSEWISQSSTSVMYSMMVGFFIIVSIICYLIRLS